MNNTKPDGEYFVDVEDNPIPAASTWIDLSVNQLIDIKNTLESKFWVFRNSPAMAQALKTQINNITKIIEQRSSV